MRIDEKDFRCPHIINDRLEEQGRRIVEEEQNGKDRADYGTHLLKELAAF